MKQTLKSLLLFMLIALASTSVTAQQSSDEERYRQIIENHQTVDDFRQGEVKKFVSVQRRLNRYGRSLQDEFPPADQMNEKQKERYTQKIAGKTLQTIQNYGLERKRYALMLNAYMTSEQFRKTLHDEFNFGKEDGEGTDGSE